MRIRYKDSYQKVTGIDAQGRMADQYAYVGGHYVLPFDERRKRATGWMQLALFAGQAGALGLAGMVNPDSSRTFYVVYPYLFVYLPLLFLLLGIVSYMGCGLRLQVDMYDKSIRRIRRSQWGVILMAALAAACDVAYLILNRGQVRLGRELLYLGGLIVVAALGIAYGKCYDRMFSGIILDP